MVYRVAAFQSILDQIGNSPLVRLNRLPDPDGADVYVKLETANPGGSVKDRIALAMINEAERSGRLQPGDTLVEPTSGNTGIGLALVAAVKGYKLIITMPEDKSNERRKLMEHLGAQVILTPARTLMQGAVEKAQKIIESNPRCFMPQQFDNAANPAAHAETTGLEIIESLGTPPDCFVSGVGTGGTVSGLDALRMHSETVRIIGRATGVAGTGRWTNTAACDSRYRQALYQRTSTPVSSMKSSPVMHKMRISPQRHSLRKKGYSLIIRRRKCIGRDVYSRTNVEGYHRCHLDLRQLGALSQSGQSFWPSAGAGFHHLNG